MAAEQSVQDFIYSIQAMHEPDFGDFKRKAGMYLSRLEQNATGSPEIKILLSEVRDRLFFNSNGQVEQTRKFIVERAAQLL